MCPWDVIQWLWLDFLYLWQSLKIADDANLIVNNTKKIAHVFSQTGFISDLSSLDRYLVNNKTETLLR